MKRIALLGLLAAALVTQAVAGSVTLGWDTYVQGGTNAVVDLIKVYAVPGTNTTFTAGNSNAVFVASTSVTNTTLSLSNLWAGPWTFVATARSTSANLESDNSNSVWTIVPVKGVVNLRVNVASP